MKLPPLRIHLYLSLAMLPGLLALSAAGTLWWEPYSVTLAVLAMVWSMVACVNRSRSLRKPERLLLLTIDWLSVPLTLFFNHVVPFRIYYYLPGMIEGFLAWACLMVVEALILAAAIVRALRVTNDG